jgi:hypothetical protein
MTNLEKEVLQVLANRINKLASLENASFNMDEEKDKQVKKTISPYMMWFEAVAFDIEKIIELSGQKNDFIKKEQLEEIIRLNL